MTDETLFPTFAEGDRVAVGSSREIGTVMPEDEAAELDDWLAAASKAGRVYRVDMDSGYTIHCGASVLRPVTKEEDPEDV